MKIKQKLYKICEQHVDQRIEISKKRLASILESRNHETKSSAGDKYETGRAMMQMEEEKSLRQLSQAQAVKNELARIDIDKKLEQIDIGSLVVTNLGIYFIAIGIGKVTLADECYYCVSTNAPIALAMRQRRMGDEITFNGKKMLILEIH